VHAGAGRAWLMARRLRALVGARPTVRMCASITGTCAAGAAALGKGATRSAPVLAAGPQGAAPETASCWPSQVPAKP